MSAMASQVTDVSIVCLIVCSGADQRRNKARVTDLCESYHGGLRSRGINRHKIDQIIRNIPSLASEKVKYWSIWVNGSHEPTKIWWCNHSPPPPPPPPPTTTPYPPYPPPTPHPPPPPPPTPPPPPPPPTPHPPPPTPSPTHPKKRRKKGAHISKDLIFTFRAHQQVPVNTDISQSRICAPLNWPGVIYLKQDCFLLKGSYAYPRTVIFFMKWNLYRVVSLCFNKQNVQNR